MTHPRLFPPFSLLVCESTIPFCIPALLYILTPPPQPIPVPQLSFKGGKIYMKKKKKNKSFDSPKSCILF